MAALLGGALAVAPASSARAQGSVSGTVTVAGEPVRLQVRAWDSIGTYLGAAYSSRADGTYQLDGLDPGEVRIQFRALSYDPFLGEYYLDQPDLASATPVLVTSGGQTSGIDGQLTAKGSIAGTLTDPAGAPLEGICVDAYYQNSPGSDWYRLDQRTHSEADGTFEVGGLRESLHKVRFSPCDNSRSVETEWYDDQPDEDSAAPIDVFNETTTGGIDAVLSPTGAISGTVTTDVVNAFNTICVNAFLPGEERPVGSTTMNQDGTYRIVAVPDGAYQVQFKDCTFKKNISEWYNDHELRADSNLVTVNHPVDTSGINASLAPLADDTTPPDTAITSGPVHNSTVYNKRVTFTMEVLPQEDSDNFECRLDTGAYEPCRSPRVYPEMPDGTHTFTVRGKDRAGNVDPTPATRTFTVDGSDTTAPDTLIISGPAEGARVKPEAVTFAFTASPSGPGDTFECRIRYASYAPCVSPVSYPDATNTKTFEVRATDRSENVDDTPATRTFTVDTTAPETVLVSGPSGGAVVSTPVVTFEFSGSADTARFQCGMDAGSWGVCASPYSSGALADGAHAFRVRAIDEAGNVDETPRTAAFTVDTTAPETVLVSGPSGGAVVTTSVVTHEFSGSADTARFQCRMDADSWGACTSPHSSGALADGAHTLFVRAIDDAGNVDASPISAAFSVDTGPSAACVEAHADVASATAQVSKFAKKTRTAKKQLAKTKKQFKKAKKAKQAKKVKRFSKRVATLKKKVKKFKAKKRAAVDLRRAAEADVAENC